MKKEDIDKIIISKEDFKDYFNCKKVITIEELEKYYMVKNVNNFNAIFNATPRKNKKKRSVMK